MAICYRKAVCVISIVLVCFFIVGCGEPARTTIAGEVDLGTTIDSLAEVFLLDAIGVEGYGLVGGLNGTGSVQCPPQIRAYLEQYILKHLPQHKVPIEKLISSRDTAVVRVYGIMPAAPSRKQRFDVRVEAISGAPMRSLEGGQLYGADLKAAGFGMARTKILAMAEGPVFIDTVGTSEPDKKAGYVLAGGTVVGDYKMRLAFRQPDYRITSQIRNRLNERFGGDTAKAVSPSQIVLNVPAEYGERKQRFVLLIKATYLEQNPQITDERIRTLVRRLAGSEEKSTAEISLEAIGEESLGGLAVLLSSSDEEVRLRAARCMLNLGSDRGLGALRRIAMNKGSAYRFEALEAITAAASRNDAAVILRRLLQDEDYDISLAAYEALRKLDDIAITQRFVGRNFYLEQIAQAEHKAIFVSRSGQPRIVLFGAPIYCRGNIFVQSADGNITINAPFGQKYVSIIRKHPTRPDVVVQLKSSYELGDIIQTLCEEPLRKSTPEHLGLGVSYAEAIALLKQMCDKGAVEAEFRAGPLPKIS